LVISYLLTAVACGFAALCYAELAAMIPVAGSAYTYAYVGLGEIFAWIIGWDLIIEYAVGNIVVAVSWSGYFKKVLQSVGLKLPGWMATDLSSAFKSHGAAAFRQAFTDLAAGLTPAHAESVRSWVAGFGTPGGPDLVAQAPHLFGLPILCNFPAFAIVALITVVLVVGMRESAWLNSVMVALKLLIVVAFIVVGVFYVHPVNWHPFAPNGWSGIQAGAFIVFFSYIGFDAVSTTAEEAKNPQRDMPIGMIASLIVCTVLYIAVTLVLTGMTSYKNLGDEAAIATAMEHVGLTRFAGLLSLGAVIAMTAVLLVFQMGQPRIFFSMARDGLLPKWFAKVHPRFRTPYTTTILTGVFVGVFSMFADENFATELTNIGTLFAFVLVSCGVIALRYHDKDRPRPFRVPGSPVVPGIAAVSCIWLMKGSAVATWYRFGVWLLIGLTIYFFYGRRRSRLAAKAAGAATEAPTSSQSLG
jgi:APA family basic amino acid/polyamine antiporter